MWPKPKNIYFLSLPKTFADPASVQPTRLAGEKIYPERERDREVAQGYTLKQKQDCRMPDMAVSGSYKSFGSAKSQRCPS